MNTLQYTTVIFVSIVIGFILSTLAPLSELGVDTDQSTERTAMDKSKGFHPIHVYYGNDNAINNLPIGSYEMKQKHKKGSQVKQDEIILALMEKITAATSTTPFFIDLAANDAIQLSNTLKLEEHGWDGLCIEPNPIYWFRLAHRKCTVVGAFVGGKDDMEEIEVSLANEEFGGIIGEKMDNSAAGNISSKKKQSKAKRYSVSLMTIFEQFHVPSVIDYMSLDVEGAEELVMRNFPFQLHSIRFLTIERPKPMLQTFLKENGYTYIMMLVSWGETLWVSDDVLKTTSLSLEEIQKTVRSISSWPDRKTGKSQKHVFNITTGEFTLE